MKASRGIELNTSRHPLVVLRAGSAYAQPEWDRMVLGMVELIRQGPFGLITDARGGQMPNAVQRRSIVKVYEDYDRETRSHFLVAALVGESTLVRGVVTALTWVRPPPHPVKVFASLAEAEPWVLGHFPAALRQRVPPSGRAALGGS